MSKKVEPLSISINTTTNRTANGVSGDVPLSYRFGLRDSHGLESASRGRSKHRRMKILKNHLSMQEREYALIPSSVIK